MTTSLPQVLAVLAILLSFVFGGCNSEENSMNMAELTPSRVTDIARDAAKSGNASSGREAVAASVAAADAFIGTLTEEQRTSAMYALDDPLRPNWSNLPAGILDFERNGIRLNELSDTQLRAAFQFLAAALSVDGYTTVIDIVGADEVLSHSTRAGHFAWTDENYWLAFFGTPSESEKWGWQFGGHHLGVNFTLVDGRVYMSPTFIGVEPASYKSGDSVIAPLQDKLEAGIALINRLDDDQRARAMVNDRPEEVWTGAGNDGFVPEIEGSRVGDWSEEQQKALRDMIPMWIGMLDEESGSVRIAEIGADLNDTYFGWHGKTDGSGPIYYRIQGPAVIIEYSTQSGVGADTGHYHSIYREPKNEYGVNADGR